MGDLKTFWQPGDEAMPSLTDASGQLPTARGGDPNIDTGGSSGLKDFWSQDQPVDNVMPGETTNSVSGLPLHPDRFQPSEQPPQPPDLTDRNPGTIDER